METTHILLYTTCIPHILPNTTIIQYRAENLVYSGDGSQLSKERKNYCLISGGGRIGSECKESEGSLLKQIRIFPDGLKTM